MESSFQGISSNSSRVLWKRTNRSVVIKTWSSSSRATYWSCGQCSSRAAGSKRWALAFHSPMRICHIVSQRRGELHLGLCTTSGFVSAKRTWLRSGHTWWILWTNALFNRTWQNNSWGHTYIIHNLWVYRVILGHKNHRNDPASVFLSTHWWSQHPACQRCFYKPLINCHSSQRVCTPSVETLIFHEQFLFFLSKSDFWWGRPICEDRFFTKKHYFFPIFGKEDRFLRPTFDKEDRLLIRKTETQFLQIIKKLPKSLPAGFQSTVKKPAQLQTAVSIRQFLCPGMLL